MIQITLVSKIVTIVSIVNIILPLDGLVKFLEENFVCKRCQKVLTSLASANDDEQQRPPLSLEVFDLPVV
jgi:hypothetical protein